jgi:hypothetical protein
MKKGDMKKHNWIYRTIIHMRLLMNRTRTGQLNIPTFVNHFTQSCVVEQVRVRHVSFQKIRYRR